MKYNPAIHHRRSIRLKGYDYALPGVYFVTMDTLGQEALLGEVVNTKMVLSAFGRTVQEAWLELPRHYPQVELGEFVIMPNHVHGIIILNENPTGRGGSETCPYNGDDPNVHHGLPEIVRAFKSFSARRINILRCTPGQPVWQRNYYEHIIRSQDELERISAYIQANPANWKIDMKYPAL